MNKLLNLLLVLPFIFLVAFKEVDTSRLLGTKWNIDMIKDGEKSLPAPTIYTSGQGAGVESSTAFIEFNAKSKLSGFTGSNVFNTTFKEERDGSIRIGQVATTRMASRFPDYERTFLKALSETTHFVIKDDTLLLKSAEGKTIAFASKAKEPKKPSLNLSNTKWIPVYIEDGKPFSMTSDERMPFIEFSSKDKINGFAGDNIFNGSYKLEKNGDFKIGDNMAVTMMMGINGEYEYAFLQALRKVSKAEIKDEGMLCLFDKKGKLLMHLKPYAWIEGAKKAKSTKRPVYTTGGFIKMVEPRK